MFAPYETSRTEQTERIVREKLGEETATAASFDRSDQFRAKEWTLNVT